jgi:hypothetical protein
MPNLTDLELDGPVAVACHDAGAANIIQAWILSEPQRKWRCVMAGPAARQWQHLSGGASTHSSIASALNGASTLLSGTGWESSFEHDARQIARSMGLMNVAVLDHWTNYLERFTRNEEALLPDQIFVTDAYALQLAKEKFPSIPIKQKENLYLKRQLSEIDKISANTKEVLYLLEPIVASWPKNKTGEIEALEYFFSKLNSLDIPISAPIRLRPHPSENPAKYEQWLAGKPELFKRRKIVIDNSSSLSCSISSARWVFGCQTYAMVIALHAGRSVFSTLPPWAPICSLPHSEIISLGGCSDSL